MRCADGRCGKPPRGNQPRELQGRLDLRRPPLPCGRRPEHTARPGHRQRILFRLAELVGKVAHNEAGPPPFFDHHTGWQIGPLACVRDRIADALGERPPEPFDG
ncbi:hypothetical protein [Streptomyces sp. NPDC001492]